MRLSDILSESLISTSLQRRDKNGIIEELLNLAAASGKIKNRDAVLQAVLEREKLMSTGLEKGVALPHAKTDDVDGLVLAVAISKDGIDFQSADGQPSHLFFFLLAPKSEAGPNLQVLAKIAGLTNSPEFCQQLIHAISEKEVLDLIRDEEN